MTSRRSCGECAGPTASRLMSSLARASTEWPSCGLSTAGCWGFETSTTSPAHCGGANRCRLRTGPRAGASRPTDRPFRRPTGRSKHGAFEVGYPPCAKGGNMRKPVLLVAFAVAVALAGSAATASSSAPGPKNYRANLEGFQENPSLSTTGHGHVSLRIDDAAETIEYELTYDDLEGVGTTPFVTNGVVVLAHIHVSAPGVNGGVAVFFCGGGGKPPARRRRARSVASSCQPTWSARRSRGSTREKRRPSRNSSRAFAPGMPTPTCTPRAGRAARSAVRSASAKGAECSSAERGCRPAAGVRVRLPWPGRCFARVPIGQWHRPRLSVCAPLVRRCQSRAFCLLRLKTENIARLARERLADRIKR